MWLMCTIGNKRSCLLDFCLTLLSYWSVLVSVGERDLLFSKNTKVSVWKRVRCVCWIFKFIHCRPLFSIQIRQGTKRASVHLFLSSLVCRGYWFLAWRLLWSWCESCCWPLHLQCTFTSTVDLVSVFPNLIDGAWIVLELPSQDWLLGFTEPPADHVRRNRESTVTFHTVLSVASVDLSMASQSIRSILSTLQSSVSHIHFIVAGERRP